MKEPKLLLVGGFLGVGKTTLIGAAAERLARRGVRAAAVSNDQAGSLVDTAYFHDRSIPTAEVAGSCFCCAFGKLESAVEEVVNRSSAGVVFAEPVGSCTDIAATVVRPWIRRHGAGVGPLSVAVDAARLEELDGVFVRERAEPRSSAGDRMPDEARYILRKQVDEADVLVVTKADEMSEAGRTSAMAYVRELAGGRPVVCVSARTGEGLDAWLDLALSDAAPGERRIGVDYDTYAAGEAAMGWLNAAGSFDSSVSEPGEPAIRAFMSGLKRWADDAGVRVAHAKARLGAGPGAWYGNLTGNAVQVRRAASAEPRAAGGREQDRGVLINVRAITDPGTLRAGVDRALRENLPGARLDILHALVPGRPVPTYRM